MYTVALFFGQDIYYKNRLFVRLIGNQLVRFLKRKRNQTISTLTIFQIEPNKITKVIKVFFLININQKSNQNQNLT